MQFDRVHASLSFHPLAPLWLLAGLGLLCLLALLPGMLRRARGWPWRLAAFAALLFWLSGPLLVREMREGLSDIALLVIDRSASMALKDRAQLAEDARRTLAASIPQAARPGTPPLELRTVTVPEAGKDGTRLFAAIAQGLADIPKDRLAGIVAVTDGQVHDVPPLPAHGAAPSWNAPSWNAPSWNAAPWNAPLHVLLTGRGEETDRRLRIIEAPAYGIVGKSVVLRVAVDDLGVKHPEPAATLTIRRDGEAPEQRTVPVGQDDRIEIPITRDGPTVVELTAAALPGEVSPVNNRAVVSINGVRDRLRVLLVSGEPHQGERTWRRLLKADPSVDLVHFTILRPPEKDDNTPLNELALIAFPVRELFQDKIGDFDLIILDRFQNRGILPQIYLRHIADYVQQGGALLMTAGPEFASPVSLANSPLGAILPAMPEGLDSDEPLAGVVEGPFRPHVTPLGARHPVTENLPGAPPSPPDGAPPSAARPAEPEWGPWYRYIAVSNPAEGPRGQTVLATPDGAPLLMLDHVGKGRVALLLSDQIWLWSRGHQGGGPQAELLRRVAHWSMKQPELEERALTARIENGRLTAQLRSPDEIPPGSVTVTDPDGHDADIPLQAAGPGRALATTQAAAPGVWRVRYRTPAPETAGGGSIPAEQTAFAAAIPPDPAEIADLRATATVLEGVARASGGSVRWLSPDGAPAIRRVSSGENAAGSSWIGLRRNDAHLVTGIDALPLLPAWAALPLILALMLAAWLREGR